MLHACRRYELDQEEALEEAYQGYLERRGKREAAVAQKRARLGKPGDVLSQPPVQEENAERGPITFQEEPVSGGGLLVDHDADKKSPAQLAKDWFAQDIFKAYGGLLSPEDISSHKRQKTGDFSADNSSEDEAEQGAAVTAKDDSSDEELKPQPATNYDASDSDASSASDVEEPDPNAAAEIRAVAKAMLSGRRKNDIIEDGYHRYAFHDTGLPKWFAEDESRHMRPPAVVTKDEIEAEKERMKAIDARPLKKIAEAKARKKKRLQVRLEQAKSKANSIMEQGDLSDRAKAKEVAALMAKAKTGTKSKKKPSRNDKFKKKGPPLDRRLFSDKRQIDNKKKKAAAKARKKKSGTKSKAKR